MDAKVIYWTVALLNMALLGGFALSGVLQARRGEYSRHRRSMLIAIVLVAGFVLSYGLKLAVLGREDLSVWNPLFVNTLRFHETCILTMVISGGLALRRGHGLARTRLVSDAADAPEADPAAMARHRLAGRIALWAAGFGFASAAIVLAGMYARM